MLARAARARVAAARRQDVVVQCIRAGRGPERKAQRTKLCVKLSQIPTQAPVKAFTKRLAHVAHPTGEHIRPRKRAYSTGACASSGPGSTSARGLAASFVRKATNWVSTNGLQVPFPHGPFGVPLARLRSCVDCAKPCALGCQENRPAPAHGHPSHEEGSCQARWRKRRHAGSGSVVTHRPYLASSLRLQPMWGKSAQTLGTSGS